MKNLKIRVRDNEQMLMKKIKYNILILFNLNKLQLKS